MAERIMYVQLKSGHDTDMGPAWIGCVRFSRSRQTAYFHSRTLRREQGLRGNFVDVDTGDEWWLSGPKHDQTDGRYAPALPTVDPARPAAKRGHAPPAGRAGS